MNYNQTLIELLQNTTAWTELKSKLEGYNTSQTETTTKETRAGKLFEYFAKYYFIIEPEQAQLYSDVWLYEEIPSDIKAKLNFPDRDFGIDLLLKDNQDRFIAVQCKFKNDEEVILQWSKDKIANPFALSEKCDSVMIFTNAADCVEEAKQREKFNLICIGHLLNTSSEVFSAIKEYIETKKIKAFEKFKRLPHQVVAVDTVVSYLKDNERGQLILPCGAGKTLAALWIKEDLLCKSSLVLFPSLALLRQFKTEWANQRDRDYIYLNVCSEKDIDTSTDDSTVTHTYEISGEVTTSPDRIREFLFHSTKDKIVFSTYQSIEAIETALQFLPNFSFDLIICDEAHRTAGAKSNTFAIVHDQSRIRGKKRLYMTATPKVVSNKLKARLGEDYELLCDMSNPEIFGEEAYQMSFGDAIIQNILVDYKIVGIGVTHKQVKEFIEKRRYVTEKYDMKEVADNFALDIVMEKYSAFHAITFHSRIKLADEFSRRHNAYFSPDVYSRHLSGEHTTSKRVKVLKEFKDHNKGVVSNARCLTEGVDVPIIDLIYFCDPKNSKIDIVQASGRALRKDRHGNKTIGYIVVPIYHHIDEDIEKEIEKKPYFQNLVSVIRSLCDQDERLRAEIDDVAFEKGEKKSKRIEITYDNSEIESVIKLEGLDKKVREFLFEQIIEKTRNYWNVKFQQLKAFIEMFGHSTISKGDEHYRDLYYWVGNIRKSYHEGKLSKEKIKKLEGIKFDWKGEQRLTYLPPDQKWQKNYLKLVKYYEEHGDTDIPARYKPDKPLATWCVGQGVKYRNGKLSKEQIELLEDIDFDWERKNIFEEKLRLFKAYKDKHGDLYIPQGNTEHKREGRWVNRLRSIYNSGTPNAKGDIVSPGLGIIKKSQLDRLNEIGFVWFAGNVEWDERFQQLKEYYEATGTCQVKLTENITLFYWCYRQKNRIEKLEPEQIEKLKSIDFFSGDVDITRTGNEDDFIDYLNSLQTFYEENKTFESSSKSPMNFKLARWLKQIKKEFRKGTLEAEKIELLNGIGFDFGEKAKRVLPIDQRWLAMYEQAKKHFEATKTFVTDNWKLTLWFRTQRAAFKKQKLSPEKQSLLEKLGFTLTTPTNRAFSYGHQNSWENHFQELKEYYYSHQTFFISETDKEHKELRSWITTQRSYFKKNALPKERKEKLLSIGYDFEKRYSSDLSKPKAEKAKRVRKKIITKQKPKVSSWDEFFLKLLNYKLKHGDCNVRKSHSDKSLNEWVVKQRTHKRKNLLTTEQVSKLDLLGFTWGESKLLSDMDVWMKGYENMKQFYATHKHTTLTVKNSDKQMRSWATMQRHRKRNEDLKPEYVKLLDGLNFDWEPDNKGSLPDEERWMERFQELIAFKEKFKTTNVSQTNKEYYKLSRWVLEQRRHFTKNKLSDFRKQKLEAIGFIWDARKEKATAQL